MLTRFIFVTQIFQPGPSPISHVYHDSTLIHLEIARLIELKQSLPTVTKAIRPFPRKRIPFVPDKFFSPEPSLFAKLQNQLQDVNTTLPGGRTFFNVQYQRSAFFQNPFELFATLQKPCHKLTRRNAVVFAFPRVSIWGRGKD